MRLSFSLSSALGHNRVISKKSRSLTLHATSQIEATTCDNENSQRPHSHLWKPPPTKTKAKQSPPAWIQARWTALCILHNPSMQATVPPYRNPTLESTASSAHATHPWPPHTQPTRNCTPEKEKACTKLEWEHVEDGLPRSLSADCNKWDTESKRCRYKGQHTKRKETKERKKDQEQRGEEERVKEEEDASSHSDVSHIRARVSIKVTTCQWIPSEICTRTVDTLWFDILCGDIRNTWQLRLSISG